MLFLLGSTLSQPWCRSFSKARSEEANFTGTAHLHLFLSCETYLDFLLDVVNLFLCFSYQFSAFLGSTFGPSFYLLIQSEFYFPFYSLMIFNPFKMAAILSPLLPNKWFALAKFLINLLGVKFSLVTLLLLSYFFIFFLRNNSIVYKGK